MKKKKWWESGYKPTFVAHRITSNDENWSIFEKNDDCLTRVADIHYGVFGERNKRMAKLLTKILNSSNKLKYKDGRWY